MLDVGCRGVIFKKNSCRLRWSIHTDEERCGEGKSYIKLSRLTAEQRMGRPDVMSRFTGGCISLRLRTLARLLGTLKNSSTL